jgi:hypothetical protein
MNRRAEQGSHRPPVLRSNRPIPCELARKRKSCPVILRSDKLE